MHVDAWSRRSCGKLASLQVIPLLSIRGEAVDRGDGRRHGPEVLGNECLHQLKSLHLVDVLTGTYALIYGGKVHEHDARGAGVGLVLQVIEHYLISSVWP